MPSIKHRGLMLAVALVAGCMGSSDTTTTVETGIQGCSAGACVASQCQEWFADLDGDGYGAGPAQIGCGDPPSGYAATPGDCCDVGGTSRAVAATINPSQEAFFAEAQTACPNIGAFDYNCSGSIADQFGISVGVAQAGNCDANCNGSGWVLDTACGAEGTLVECSRYQGYCAIDSRSPSQRVVRECN